MSRLGTKKDVQFVKSVAFPISLKRVDDLKQYLDTKNIHPNAEIMFEDAKHTKRFTDIPWNILRMVVVIYHHDKGKVSSQEILDAIKTYRLSVPLNKNGSNIKTNKMKINYAKKYPNLYKITTNFGDNESGADWNKSISYWQGTNAIREDRLQLADDFVKKQLIPLNYEGVPFPGDAEEYDTLVKENVGARYLVEFYNLLDDPIRVSDYINPDDIEKDEDDFYSSDSIEDKWVTYIRVCEIAHNNDVDDAEMVEEFDELVLDTYTAYGIKENSKKADDILERLGLICGGSEGSAYANGNFDKAIVEIKTYLKKIKPKQAKNGANIKTNIKTNKMARKLYDYDEYMGSATNKKKPDLKVKNPIDDEWGDVSVWYIGKKTIVYAPYSGAGVPEMEIDGIVKNKEELLCYAKGLAGSGEEGDIFESGASTSEEGDYDNFLKNRDKMAKGGYVFKGDKYQYAPSNFTYTIGGL
jgi:hypothetical protein